MMFLLYLTLVQGMVLKLASTARQCPRTAKLITQTSNFSTTGSKRSVTPYGMGSRLINGVSCVFNESGNSQCVAFE